MEMKSRKPRGLLVRVGRYEDDPEKDTLVYLPRTDPDEQPHSWEYIFSEEDWKAMGGRLPPTKDTVPARLVVEYDEEG